jgi:catechol 2,3-dioxygenase-like lactoylglutathione lyase family enzyme
VNEGVGISGVRQIAVSVSDLDAALTFYRDTLGLGFLFAAEPSLAFVAAGDVRLMLTAASDEHPAGASSIVYFSVADTAYDTVRARGGTGERGPQLTARMPDHELWIAFVRDPDGNLIGLMEERRPA